MLMGDENVVGTWHDGIVSLGLQRGHGIHIEIASVVFYLESGMLDAGELDFLARFGLKDICLTLLGMSHSQKEECQTKG
jgi:hypothetical protein